MTDAIEAMKDAFTEISSGESEVPIRTFLGNVDKKSCQLSMPCYSKRKGLYSVKLVTVFPENKNSGLPIIHGKLMLFDASNGKPLALLDAEYLTALRTGAASGLATQLLSREDSSVLAIIGTGKQALLQVEAVLAVRPIQKILVKGTTKSKAETFSNKLIEKFNVASFAINHEDELLQADIICTTTTSSLPVIDSRFIKPGVHINAIGGYRADMQEIPSTIMQNAFIVIDQYKAALEEAGDIIIPINEGLIKKENIVAELGELVSGMKPLKENTNQISVFKSVGNAMQDLMIGRLVLKKLEVRA